MKPHEAYNSIKKKKGLFNLFLFIVLGSQILFIVLIDINIPLPSFATKVIASIISKESSILIKDLEYNFPNKFRSNKIKFLSKDNYEIQIDNLEIELDLSKIIFNNLNYVKKLNIDNISFSKKSSLILIKDIDLSFVKLNYILKSKVIFNEISIDIFGLINTNSLNKFKRYFDKILLNPDLKKDESITFKKLFDNRFNFSLQSVFTLNDDLEISLSQVRKSKKKEMFSDFIGQINAKVVEEKLIFKKSLGLKNFRFGISKNILNVERIGLQTRLIFTNNFDNQIEHSSSFISPQIEGYFSGELPDSYLYVSGSMDDYYMFLFNDSNYCKSYLSIDNSNNTLGFIGNSSFVPKNCNISLTNTRGTRKLISGDFLNLKINSTLSAPKPEELLQFDLAANNFSFLESPPGNFFCKGTINENLDIFVYNAFGDFGSSKVEGNFTQKWNPANYQFIVDGSCQPTDLNQWMPSWWKGIWVDFNFTEDIPLGSFNIQGIWGENSTEALTFGKVDSKDFSFRDMEFKNSAIEVSVDYNDTFVNCIALTHTEGTISGSLKFPRRNSKSPYFLELEFDGDYPLEDGRNVLGETIKSKISDLNASLIDCEVKGKIFGPDTSNTDHEIEIKVSSAENFQFKGVKIDNIKGLLSYRNNVISGNFNQLDFAGGRSSLSFDFNNSNNSDTMLVNMNLKDISTLKFMNSMSPNIGAHNFEDPKFQESGSSFEFEDNNGSFDLSLQAVGPMSNLLQFKGSGTFKLKQKNLSQIDFFTPLLSVFDKFTLSAFDKLKLLPILQNLKLPFLSVSFETLNAVFTLDHENIHFSPLELKGAISSISSKGDLNLSDGELDLTGRINPAGNLPLPVIKEITDPFSKIVEFKVSGPWHNPIVE